MSLYQFIASENLLPTLYSPKLHNLDGSEIHIFSSENDLNDLEILPVNINETFSDVAYYTTLPYIYDLNFRYIEDRLQRFYSYLVNNCKDGEKCEIWTIWLANAKNKRTYQQTLTMELNNLKKHFIPLKKLTHGRLREAVDFIDSDKTPTPLELTLF